MIMGQPGSGKSTLARAMGEATGLPVVHMDQIHWMSGWQERPRDEKRRLVAEAHAQERWVFEGGMSSTWDARVARADTVIWLDVDWPVRAWRVARRTLMDYGRTRPDLPPGCPEQFSFEFYKWIWDTRHTGRALIRRTFESAKSKMRHRFTTFAETDAYVESLTG